jgi:hypothetical protein
MGNMMTSRKSNANNGIYNNNGNVKKSKPYRNRPSKRQVLLELVSFGLILASAPAFLGGAVSIFVMYFTLVLGLIGLFAWTRRHCALFAVLAACVIALCIVNIVLRAITSHENENHGQCVPFFRYGNQFNSNGQFTGNNNNNGYNGYDTYNNSIWCGNRIIVYVTHAIIIALALLGLILALSLLIKRRNVNTATTTSETKTTRTVATA